MEREVSLKQKLDDDLKQAMKAGAIGFVLKDEADSIPAGFQSLLQGAVDAP